MPDDWDLANQADPQAMDLLFRRHRDYVYRVLLGLTGSRAQAEDLTQEVFLKVATRRQRFFRKAKFTTFLYRVAANLALDQRRKLDRERPLDVAAEDRHPLPDDPTASLNTPLLNALAQLPERQREVIVLRELEGMSNNETAAALGISGGSVKTHRSRALQRLRTYFSIPDSEGEY